MRKINILWAEENEATAMALSGILKNKVDHLDIVNNAKAVLKKYLIAHYDLILINTWMEDSLELICKIREHEASQNIKFTPMVGIFSDWEQDKNLLIFAQQKYLLAGMSETYTQALTKKDIDDILKKYVF